MNFRTVLDKTRDVDIYGLCEDIEVESVRFVIEWEVYLETREWGIKSFSPSITNITGEYEIYHEANPDHIETRQFNFAPFKENVHFRGELTDHGQLMISTLEIDLGDNSLEVS